MRLLITGSKGQLGSELKHCLESMGSEIGPIPPCYAGAAVDCVDSHDFDISDEEAVRAWFACHDPYDAVINCAALTNVDGCEHDEAAAYHVNALGAELLAARCEEQGAKFVQVSTDYVFPGSEPSARVESDPACPISAYGRSKWAGEVLAQAACSRVFVVRTAWLYGYQGKNFVKTMVRVAREHGSIAVVADQVGNPTHANDVAHVILALASTEEYGVYHCTNNGECSWYDFACAIVDWAGIPCQREALTSAEYKRRVPLSADRPAYSSLDNKHLRDSIGDDMRPWQDALASFFDRLPERGGQL